MDRTFWVKQTEDRGWILGGAVDQKQKNTGKQRLYNQNFGDALDYINKIISNLDFSQTTMPQL